MRERLNIEEIRVTDTELILQVNESADLAGMKATGQMLVDSSNFAFIYLMEKNDEYTYVVMAEGGWPLLKEGLAKELPFVMSNGVRQVVLDHANDELTYLIDNISGNSNYGEEMVTKVEAVFSPTHP